MTNDDLQLKIGQFCKDVKIPGFFQEFQKQEADPAFCQEPFSRRLYLMLQAEIESRHEKRQNKLFKESGIKDVMPDVARITYESDRGLKKSLVNELSLCHWIDQEQGLNVIITGMAGTGKTWLAKALGKQAINAGLSTVYWHAATLIDRIKQARSDNEPIQFRNRLNAKKLLIIDDFGMTPMDEATRDDFFSFIDERGQAGGSLIIASQRGFGDWYSYIGDKYHADAILDRLKNRSYFVELKGRSYRERTKEAKKVRAAE